ncbi:MAG: FtsW/RodA/SpoVE family cell cycle protein [Anaerolineae bacterium]|nr:rod shape-determining protein RodA [Anaerolineae bacterium]MDW7992015.1 FtsW/RodA/SpoVE family cell cycle protein [Anaerolineae bacterium]MDW8069172.1 FtsW/RodA/SpoVE family cell cycle protein [Anaerolineae bacterium]
MAPVRVQLTIAMEAIQPWRRFDFVLLACALLLIALGVAMIRSATMNTPDLTELWRRQATYAGLGLVLFLILSATPYTWWRSLWPLLYLLAAGLLVLVLFIGQSEIGDVRRWFYIGSFRFQPSFPGMVLHVLTLASVFTLRVRKERRLPGDGSEEESPPGLLLYGLSGILTLILAALVFREPDLSTAAIYGVIWLAMAFAAGVRLIYLAGTGLLGMVGAIPLWYLMEEYQRQRILVFLNPEKDPGALYNLRQALISIGSGGFWGQGYGGGSQSQLHFLRVRHTDFIFSVIGEELGFIGIMVMFFLFTLIAWRLLRAAVLAPDRFGRLIVVGVGGILFIPLVINVGMNLGLLPVTGLPLPFISYGGTALVTNLAALGLAESVVMRNRER